MLFASVGVQASVSESIPSKSADVSVSFVDVTTVHNGVVSIISMDCLVMTITQPAYMITESAVMQSKSVVVPKCPFRYLYNSRYNTHYSNAAYSRLITPY